jgi:hypothetical protein
MIKRRPEVNQTLVLFVWRLIYQHYRYTGKRIRAPIYGSNSEAYNVGGLKAVVYGTQRGPEAPKGSVYRLQTGHRTTFQSRMTQRTAGTLSYYFTHPQQQEQLRLDNDKYVAHRIREILVAQTKRP